jgi:NAD(P)-dependent dehydrogenase (short-subunit alcohol dehydrogenase family)
MQALNGKRVVVTGGSSILRPAEVGQRVAELLADSRYITGVAYGFRANSPIIPLDI